MYAIMSVRTSRFFQGYDWRNTPDFTFKRDNAKKYPSDILAYEESDELRLKGYHVIVVDIKDSL